MHCRLMPLAERECNRKRNVSNNKINNLNTATLHLFFFVSDANGQDRNICYIKILAVLDIVMLFVAKHLVYDPLMRVPPTDQ